MNNGAELTMGIAPRVEHPIITEGEESGNVARRAYHHSFERNLVCTWNTSEMSQMDLKLRHEVRNPNA